MSFSNLTRKLIFTASILAFSLSGFMTLKVSAENTINRGLVVSPAIMELDGDRGSSYEFTVKVANDTPDVNYSINSLVNSFEAGSEEGIPVIKELPDGSILKNWIKFDQVEFNLSPRQTFDSVFKVNIPTETKPGSYFLAITYATSGEDSKLASNKKVIIEQRVAALLFITVKGKVERQVEFKKFSTNNKVYDPFLDNFKLDYRIGTEGNVYLKPAGNIFIGNDINNPEQTLDLNPDEIFILPNSSRSFEFISKAVFNIPFLTQKVDGKKAIDLKRPWFGNQKVSANVIYADSEGRLSRQEIETQVTFVPWKSGLLLLIALGVVASGIYFFKRSKKN